MERETTEHTPGPWYGTAGWSHAHETAHYAIMRERSVGEPLVIADVGGFVKDDAVIAANARLIAAAPDMLEALESAERALDALTAGDTANFGGQSLKNVRAALARARGIGQNIDVEA